MKKDYTTGFYQWILIPITLIMFNVVMYNEYTQIKRSYVEGSYHGVVMSKDNPGGTNILTVHFDNNEQLNMLVSKKTYDEATVKGGVTFKLAPVRFMSGFDMDIQNFSILLILILVCFDAFMGVRLFDFIVKGLIDYYDTKRTTKRTLAIQRVKSSIR